LTFYLNASLSHDPDSDPVIQFSWEDLFGIGEIFPLNRTVNESVTLGEGDHILTLIVGDGNKTSDPLHLSILLRRETMLPDLHVDELQVANLNGKNDIHQGDRAIIIALLRNIGEADLFEPITLTFEYWYRDSSPSIPLWIPFSQLMREPSGL
jgi:hypothetical protein